MLEDANAFIGNVPHPAPRGLLQTVCFVTVTVNDECVAKRPAHKEMADFLSFYHQDPAAMIGEGADLNEHPGAVVPMTLASPNAENNLLNAQRVQQWFEQ